MISNPLAITLGAVFKVQREQYAYKNKLSKDEVISFAANRCALSETSLSSLEYGYYFPSAGAATRLVKSGIYQIDYSRLMLVLSIIDTMGKSFVSLKEYSEKYNSVEELISDEMLFGIMEDLKNMDWEKSYKNGYIKDQILRNGVFEKMEKYLSQNDDLPKRRTKYYAEFAEEKDLEYVYDSLVRTIPDDVMPKDDFMSFIKRRWNKNNQIITIFYKNKKKTEKIGHYRIYPLSKSVVGEIFSGGMIGSDPEQETTSTFRDAKAIWVALAAEDKNAYVSGNLISEMLRHIVSIINMPGINIVFTKSASKEGRHLMDKFGFEKIPNSDVGVLTMTEDKLEKNGIDKILSYV